MLQVRCVDDRESMRSLRVSWDALVNPADPRAIFTCHDWVSAWFDAFGSGATPHVLLAEDGNDVVGVLPLQAARDARGGLPLRQLRLMANGHSPAADLVCRPQDASRVRQTFAETLRRSALEWDWAFFPELVRSANLARLHDLYPERARSAQPARRSPYIPLAGSWDEYRTRISKRFLKVLRNNQNRVQRAHATEVECLEAPDAIEAALPDMFAIGERSWQGRARSGVGSTSENRTFYANIARIFAHRGNVRLWFLQLDGERVAFEFHLVHAGVEFGLKTGFDTRFEKLGIGTFLDQHIVQQLFTEDHLREYDLLGNADFYKQRWTSHTRDYVQVALYGGSWSARLLSLWELRLVPMLKQHDWVQSLREGVLARRAARQGTS